MQIMQSRRDFLTALSCASAAGVLGARSSLADEGPPETTMIRLDSRAPICEAPQYITEELLRAEGLTEVRYVRPSQGHDAVARGELDFDFNSGPWLASQLAAGEPVTVLAGVHSGCFELIAQEPIRTVSDLKGQKGRRLGPQLWQVLAPPDHGCLRWPRP
jgi:NitT/TauT family transport system substrate-binding protein